MPKDDINYRFTENGIVYDFYDVFVPAENFRQPSLWTSGFNVHGQLGDNTTTSRNAPVTTFAGGTTWKQVSAGKLHTAAIKTDGSLWLWGRGGEGQLGNFANTDRSTPVTTFAGGNTWKSVSGGGYHTVAIKTDGSLWVWGRNAEGNLGINISGGSRSTPVTTFVGGTDWKQVSCSLANHTAAIKTDGSLWLWGLGAEGRLGTNNTTDRSIPVTTFAGGNNWKQVSVGSNFTAAIKTDGSLWGWAWNGNGQLGTNDLTQRNTPVTTFVGGNTWKSVSCGNEYSTAIKTDGSLWSWGAGGNGRLGNNSNTNRSTPVTTFAGGNNWKQVSCGDNHTAAIKTDGSLWVWGDNSQGQYGDSRGGEFYPVIGFGGGNNWKQVSVGRLFTAAIKYQPDP